MEQKINKDFLINYDIRAPRVVLILADGKSAGEVSLDEARNEARNANLDLVEINSAANPPIVKILDYNKYRYDQSKNARTNKAKSPQLKEIRLSFRIQEHDLDVKAERVKEFLQDGDFVRAFINLRGRENIFPNKAKETLQLFAEKVGGVVDGPPSQIGKRVQLTIKAK